MIEVSRVIAVVFSGFLEKPDKGLSKFSACLSFRINLKLSCIVAKLVILKD